jgi:hypothetical protein
MGEKSRDLPLRRALMLPTLSTQDDSTTHFTFRQTASLYFAKLPLELRQRVYGELFGHTKIHILWHEDGLKHCVCRVLPSYLDFSNGWCHQLEREKMRVRLMNRNSIQLPESLASKLDISMMYTCRQRYSLPLSLFCRWGRRCRLTVAYIWNV